ncbi:MAG: tRNA pseudouridine(55) synthase TruB, partial [Alphaproteobacteria bacterium]|nr:tRNA pseudouridine(55) synthase TruB [Alphaproteobacteria bacterium]
AGHGGTLDPLATGILPIAFGEATKTAAYAMDGSKTYYFGVRWGESRSTDDREGEVIETHDHRPAAQQIESSLAAFVGTIEQIPPRYSAIKIDGRRAYDLARRDEAVELKSRRVEVRELRLVDVPDADHALLSVTCGKGTYVRALARDLAHHLDTVGHVDWLRRTAVGPFTEADAISLDKIEALGHIPLDSDLLMPIETVLDDIPALALTVQEAQRLKHGQSVSVLPVASRSTFKEIEQGDTVCAMSEGRLVALARIVDGGIHPVRVMNL